MTEVLATELRTDAERARHLENLGFHLKVAESDTGFATSGRESVVVASRCVLCGLESELGRRSANDDREVIRRARGRPDGAQVLVKEGAQLCWREQGLGLLEQQTLVCTAAALGPQASAAPGQACQAGRPVTRIGTGS